MTSDTEGASQKGSGGAAGSQFGAQGYGGPSAQSSASGSRDADFNAIREDLAKLSQTVSQIVASRTTATGEQMRDSISQSAAMAQDKLTSFEQELERRVAQNPLAAVAIALGIGFFIGKMA